MPLSKKTITEFRESLTTWSLREITDLFESEDVALCEDHEPKVSGQRRTLAAKYLHSINLSNHDDVARILRVIEHVLVQLTANVEDKANPFGIEAAQRSLSGLTRWLERDGFEFRNHRLVAVNAGVAAQASRPLPMPPTEAVPLPPVTQPSPTGPPPTTVFVSYSWDDEPHKQWVMDFARRLREEGIDAKLDRWELELGSQLPHFMETAVRENDFVLIVLTPKYRSKSDDRHGGVGYEGHVMTAELFTGADHRKFIPVLRDGSWETASPSWLKGKLGVDLRRDNANFEEQFRDLKATLNRTRQKAPPLGPFQRASSATATMQGIEPTEFAKPDVFRDFTSCEHGGIKWTWQWSASTDRPSLEYIERLTSWCPACGKRIEPSDHSESKVGKTGGRDLYVTGRLYGGYNTTEYVPFTLYRCDNGCTNLKLPGYRKDREASVKREIEHRAIVRTTDGTLSKEDAANGPSFDELSIEVRSLYYQDVNEDNDSLMVVTSCPRRFRAELGLTNLSGQVVYIKDITLKTGGRTYGREDGAEVARIAAREHRVLDETFPVDDSTGLQSGEFELEITPSVGSRTKVSGRFPVDRV